MSAPFGARTVILDDGIVQQDADAQAIFDKPANLFVAKFFGDPPPRMTQPFCFPASTIAQTSLTSLFGSIMNRLPFMSS